MRSRSIHTPFQKGSASGPPVGVEVRYLNRDWTRGEAWEHLKRHPPVVTLPSGNWKPLTRIKEKVYKNPYRKAHTGTEWIWRVVLWRQTDEVPKDTSRYALVLQEDWILDPTKEPEQEFPLNTFEEFLLDRQQASFDNQDRREKNRRMSYVIKLSKVLSDILDHSIQSTALAQGAIEAVLIGDWKTVEDSAKDFESTKTLAEIGVYERVELWQELSTLLYQASRTRPKDEPDEPV